MSGDTRLKRTPQGWVDLDNPTNVYGSRRQARDARRRGSSSISAIVASASATTLGQTQTSQAAQALTITPAPGSSDSYLTSLQARLLDRLTTRQGVDLTDALSVITSNGYNKAASYGHMRQAGATHDEALAVINLDSPGVSQAYGLHRALGYNHADALRDAVVIGGLDDDSDD
jgi:hypothetical protein